MIRRLGSVLLMLGATLLLVLGFYVFQSESSLQDEAQVAVEQYRETAPVAPLQAEDNLLDMDEYQEPRGTPGAARVAPLEPVDGVWGTITVPALDFEGVIREGTTEEQLGVGLGHYEQTTDPGETGNAALAVHRGMMPHLDQLTVGDVIVLDLVNGVRMQYVVTVYWVVEPDAVWVLDSIEGTALTITTCHPRFSTDKRLVVRAELEA